METGIKERINATIGLMEAFNFLQCRKNYHGADKMLADAYDQAIMFYTAEYFFDVCVALERIPDITENRNSDTDTHPWKAMFYYKEYKFYIYLRDVEKETLEDLIANHIWEEGISEVEADADC